MVAWIDSIPPDITNITASGRNAALAAGFVFPDSISGPGPFNHRAVLWSGISPVMTFYQTEAGKYGVRYPASAIRMGSGFFVHVQWTGKITLHSDMVFAFITILTYYLAFKFDLADFYNDCQGT